MALPGLGLALPGLDSGLPASNDPHQQQQKASTAAGPRVHTLAPQSEYRFETSTAAPDDADAPPLRLTLQSGTAELFGTELAPGATYEFRGAAKAAVHTWRGCALRAEGPADAEYVAAAAGAAAQYASVHFALEGARAAAAAAIAAGVPPGAAARGPRVLVVGAENAGKTSVCRTLAAYALRAGRVPLVANLDARQGMLGVPGALSAAGFASLLDVRDGWGASPVSGPSAVPVKMPLCYHFGCRDPEENQRLFGALVTRLGAATLSRMDGDAETGAAGCIIDTPGSLSSGRAIGCEIIEHIVMAFSVNVLLVLGSERLYSEMRRRFPPSNHERAVTVIRLDKSGGCVDRDEEYMRKLRQTQIREYFYGQPSMALSPTTQVVDFSQIAIFRIAKVSTAPSAFDPGAEADDDDDEYDPTALPSAGPVSSSSGTAPLYHKFEPSQLLQNALLAVTTAQAKDGGDGVRDASVMWYVYVTEVDEAKQRLRLLSPVSARVPANALVWGDWPESVPDLAA